MRKKGAPCDEARQLAHQLPEIYTNLHENVMPALHKVASHLEVSCVAPPRVFSGWFVQNPGYFDGNSEFDTVEHLVASTLERYKRGT